MIRKPLRKLSISKGGAAVQTPSEKQKAAQERYFVNTVKENRRFKMILSHLAQGNTPGSIAAHFAAQGWINVSERTFTECIRAYRRICATEIEQVKLEGLESFVDPNQPRSDVLHSLYHLLGVQMKRISLDANQEVAFGKLFDNTHKEVIVANKLLESIAKIEGRMDEGGSRRKGEVETTADVSENLSSLRKGEGTLNRMHGLTKQLVRPSE